ncbi:hypothetical protein DNTS_000471, partial [Danionella cerebrum]
QGFISSGDPRYCLGDFPLNACSSSAEEAENKATFGALSDWLRRDWSSGGNSKQMVRVFGQKTLFIKLSDVRRDIWHLERAAQKIRRNVAAGIKWMTGLMVCRSSILSHLKTYNLYYEGKNLQLRHREEEEELIIEGLLNISWGLRRPIRLQMQDDHERIRPPPSSTSWHSGCNLDNQSQEAQNQSPQCQPQVEVEVTPPDEQHSNGTGHHPPEDEEEEECDLSAQLLRTKSDAGVLRRSRRRSPSDQRRIRRHRFSINGHFYNHKTAVFTPAYGSVTNVRINSCMSTPQVLRVLLNKFKIENSPDDFALYLVHASGERIQLKRTDYPLVVRILQGPCEHICKIFLMEQDLGEEIPYEVAQYIKFEMPVLQSFITKLKEEEDREVQKLKSRLGEREHMPNWRLGLELGTD